MIDNEEYSPDECQYGELNGEEASFMYMIMDLEHYIKSDGFYLIYNNLSATSKKHLMDFYANKLRCESPRMDMC